VAVQHWLHERFDFAFNVIHPSVVTFVTNAVYSYFGIIYPFSEAFPEFDVYRLDGLEVFQNPVGPEVFGTVDRIRTENTSPSHYNNLATVG
jgi:hypothetical protein